MSWIFGQVIEFIGVLAQVIELEIRLPLEGVAPERRWVNQLQEVFPGHEVVIEQRLIASVCLDHHGPWHSLDLSTLQFCQETGAIDLHSLWDRNGTGRENGGKHIVDRCRPGSRHPRLKSTGPAGKEG